MPLTEFTISPQGRDSWSGRHAAPCPDGRDGPFATLRAALAAVRALPHREGPARINLRAGTYTLNQPLRLDWRAGGALENETPDKQRTGRLHPLTIRSWPGEEAILSGGRRITGWRETELWGHAMWVADLPRRRREWSFRQLWVNGERRYRPRLPREGEYQVAEVLDARFEGSWAETVMGGSSRFTYAPGDIREDWHNREDVELHFRVLWTSIMARIKAIDGKRRIVTLDRDSKARLTADHSRDGAPYIVENVFEAIEPGEWYRDRRANRLYYRPLPGEQLASTEIVAPCLERLIDIRGGAGKDPRHVVGLALEDLTFSHTEWQQPENRAMLAQSTPEVSGAVRLHGVRECRIERCRFRRLGSFGLELASDCVEVDIRHCTFEDLGAGGVKLWHGCRNNRVADCVMRHGGRLFGNATAILCGDTGGNRIEHNLIEDFFYSGIAIGWVWGYGPSRNAGNVVEWNIIRTIGQGRYSDMAGIYLLGAEPGTRVRYNRIEQVRSRKYGGHGIYLDEGCKRVLVTCNVVAGVTDAAFNQHYGKDNRVENNIFYMGAKSSLRVGQAERHRSFTATRNVCLFQGVAAVQDCWAGTLTPEGLDLYANLYWSTTHKRLRFAKRTWGQWQAFGMDRDSRVADPLFRDPAAGDFRLRAGSPARAIGFQPFVLTDAGPRVGDDRQKGH